MPIVNSSNRLYGEAEVAIFEASENLEASLVLWARTDLPAQDSSETSVAEINFAVSNALFGAISAETCAAALNLGQIQTGALFESDELCSSGDLFLRTGDEPNSFFDLLEADEQATCDLILSSAILALFESDETANAELVFGLNLVQPAPILNQLAGGAFQNQRLKVRLLINNTETPLKSFEYSKPKGTTGASLGIELSRAGLSQIPSTAAIKFQIGKWANNNYVWTTLLDYGIVTERNYRIQFSADSLSFSSIEPLADFLSLCPYQNLTVFDGAKTQVSASDLPPLYDSDGGYSLSVSRNISPLTLYDLLRIAFVEGCGFDSFQTNIPNYPIMRCDFSVSSSYLDAVRALVGIFEPVIFAVGNTLWILDKTQVVPDSFRPVSLTADKYVSYGAALGYNRNIDGFLLQYLSNGAGDYSVQRFYQPPNITSGNFGDADFTQTEINQTFLDWKNTANPNIVLRSELEAETRTTYDNSENVIGRETISNSFDGTGKRILSQKTIEANVPDLSNSGDLALQTVRRESVEFSYKTDFYNPRRVNQDKIITRISALISIDSDNKYLGKDFKQDFTKANETGNLTTSMTTDFVPVRTIIESFETLGNGQVQVSRQEIDHLRNVPIDPLSEVRNGDVSISALGSRPQILRVWRTGVNKNSAKGKAFVPFAVGELPLVFALPLAKRRLALAVQPKQTAQIQIVGFDESCERGVIFSAKDRAGANLGNYLIEGFRVSGNAKKIATEIEAVEI